MTHTRTILILAVLIGTAFVMTGWRTVSDATRDEEVKQQLKWIDRDAFALERRINDLDQRVKALENRP